MQKLIRVSINETGGEFTCGTIESDQGDLIEEIRNKIDDGDISSYCELENGDDFDAVMYDNKFHIYGPNVAGSSVTIEEADIPENKNENDLKESDFKLIFEGPIEESGIHVFESSNPGYPELEEGEITIFTKKYEKRINNVFKIKINDEEIFEPKDIFIGFMLMDETFFTEDEILEKIFYIPSQFIKIYLDKYLSSRGQNLDESEDIYQVMEDLLPEIFCDEPDQAKCIEDKHTIFSESCEGKGEWENDFLKIVDSSEETLYENGDY